MPAPQLGCTFGFGEQQNQITGFHDGSNVYGSDDEEIEKLREHKVSSHIFQINKPERNLLEFFGISVGIA
jgi:hypothetical protein